MESGIEVIIPNEDDIKIINDIIYDELCLGKVEFKSKEKYLKIIEKMKNQGVKGVILGCTEIGLLISQKDVDIKVFDTTKIHAKKIALNAIKN